MFYRGTVVGADSPYYEVMFIDYGNTERCNQSDIFTEVMCSEIPIMSYKFRLPSLNIAINQTLNSVLHSLIVDKVCNISVFDDNDSSDDEDDYCRITVDSLVINSFQDVTNYLIQ